MQAPGERGTGWDRRRVGARLCAALAGLQELQVLRERQQARVRGALRARSPSPGSAEEDPRGHERRLEGALTALKEQLFHLRQQDVGLRTHLKQLDQQISELQLGVRKGTSESPDSDSRPSSGFYELSDAASYSHSTSCTSVCSETVATFRGSLLPGSWPPTARRSENRPWSADESTVNVAHSPAWRPVLTEGKVEASGRESWDRFRPRPVSTGDLERVMLIEPQFQRASTDNQSSSLLSCGLSIPPPVVDPKYQRDLVIQSSKEVYAYPSPLHAVALQSPLFALTKETPEMGSSEPPGSPRPDSFYSRPIPEVHPAREYINKLLQRNQTQGGHLRIGMGKQGLPRYAQMCIGESLDQKGQLRKLDYFPKNKEVKGVAQIRGSSRGRPTQPPSLSLLGTQQPVSFPEASTPSESCVPQKTTGGLPLLEPCAQACSPHAALHYWGHIADSPCREEGTRIPSVLWGQLLHAPLDAKVCLPRPRTGSRRVKASKVKRRMSNRVLWPPEHQWGTSMVPCLPLEQYPSHQPHKGTAAVAAEVPRGRSCSETSLYPVSFLVPLVVAQPGSPVALPQTLYPLDAAAVGLVASGWTRKKQRRWQSTVEISDRAHLANLASHRVSDRSAGGLRARPPLPRPSSCAHSESQHSESSAECSSDVYSTVVETSEDEDGSDRTTSWFGDSESSDSEAEVRGSPVTVGQAEPTWPPPEALKPLQASDGPWLPPDPTSSRVKASRALKKKIRRFHPETLRVMTTM
ncbi:PREDICTED: dapper homolog 2-like [Chrysochloris asiatica]|uniref:Dapper homolog 2-like n=1 Tax=Chrysochloris asiatica TaxID=185453 RepID=A0A9B0X2K9_CHRAS|nr:PREDICTED: dapper homolog 2-like [Chrysochloris asiatica]